MAKPILYFFQLLLIFVLSSFSIQKLDAQSDSSLSYTPPEFIGGIKEFDNYATKYIRYPRTLLEQGIIGEVNTTIYINKLGKVKFVNALGKNVELNNEVKRVFKLMPDWKPAKKNGTFIDTMLNQRVVFLIQIDGQKMDSIATNEQDIVVLNWSKKLSIQEMNESMERNKEKSEKIRNAFELNEEGSKLYAEKKYNEALVKFNYAIKNGGNVNLFLYNRGLTYLNLDEKEKAKNDFLEAYRQGDEDAGKIYNSLIK
jgi:hypothetical protein